MRERAAHDEHFFAPGRTRESAARRDRGHDGEMRCKSLHARPQNLAVEVNVARARERDVNVIVRFELHVLREVAFHEKRLEADGEPLPVADHKRAREVREFRIAVLHEARLEPARVRDGFDQSGRAIHVVSAVLDCFADDEILFAADLHRRDQHARMLV